MNYYPMFHDSNETKLNHTSKHVSIKRISESINSPVSAPSSFSRSSSTNEFLPKQIDNHNDSNTQMYSKTLYEQTKAYGDNKVKNLSFLSKLLVFLLQPKSSVF
jgi:hypothetical protein